MRCWSASLDELLTPGKTLEHVYLGNSGILENVALFGTTQPRHLFSDRLLRRSNGMEPKTKLRRTRCQSLQLDWCLFRGETAEGYRATHSCSWQAPRFERAVSAQTTKPDEASTPPGYDEGPSDGGPATKRCPLVGPLGPSALIVMLLTPRTRITNYLWTCQFKVTLRHGLHAVTGR
jgi:hypothetical protein